MHQRDFEADSELLAELRVQDLQQAQVDKDAHRPIQNKAVKSLWCHLYATSSHIMGSSQMHMTYRSQIWGACLWLRPPSLWLTINPMDYEDPIAQILAGEHIDMDSFMSLLCLNANERATNIARDPFASASFFNFTI
jgi:hypothetical protein